VVVTDASGKTLDGVRIPFGTGQLIVPIESSGVHTVHVYSDQGEVQVTTRVQTTGNRADWDGDGATGIQDVDNMCRSIAIVKYNEAGDLNFDGELDGRDLELLVRDLLHATVGDVNLDGRFDSADLVLVFQAREYEDSIDRNSVWSTGDWNCDGDFNSADLVHVFRESRYQRSARVKRVDIAAATATNRVLGRQTIDTFHFPAPIDSGRQRTISS
jgi:hypothetical protein